MCMYPIPYIMCTRISRNVCVCACRGLGAAQRRPLIFSTAPWVRAHLTRTHPHTHMIYKHCCTYAHSMWGCVWLFTHGAIGQCTIARADRGESCEKNTLLLFFVRHSLKPRRGVYLVIGRACVRMCVCMRAWHGPTPQSVARPSRVSGEEERTSALVKWSWLYYLIPTNYHKLVSLTSSVWCVAGRLGGQNARRTVSALLRVCAYKPSACAAHSQRAQNRDVCVSSGNYYYHHQAVIFDRKTERPRRHSNRSVLWELMCENDIELW